MSVFEEPGLGFLITDIARLLRKVFQRSMVGSELTLAQSRALVYVARNPGIRQVELADRLEVQPITLARLIDQLQKLELVERRPDPNDRRAHKLYPLEKATYHLQKIEEVIIEVRKEAFAGLSEEEKQIMLKAVNQIKDNLSKSV
ncbi:MarR family winged helix-turn-helix transcriptional regulator [Aurantivibrio plasticivorans]